MGISLFSSLGFVLMIILCWEIVISTLFRTSLYLPRKVHDVFKFESLFRDTGTSHYWIYVPNGFHVATVQRKYIKNKIILQSQTKIAKFWNCSEIWLITLSANKGNKSLLELSKEYEYLTCILKVFNFVSSGMETLLCAYSI